MKSKKFIVLLLIVSSFFITNLKVKADNLSERKALGYSYNVVKSDYAVPEGIKVGAPILDEEWLNTIVFNRVDYNVSTSRMFSGLSFSELNTEIEAYYQTKISSNVDFKLFSAGAKAGFELGANFSYHNYASQYFCLNITDIERYSLSLPLYQVDLTNYKNNLHPAYLATLEKVRNNQITYETLFDTFGNHMLASAIFGGRIEIYTSIVTNEQAFDGAIKTSLNNEIQGGITGIGGASSSLSFDLKAKLGLSTGDTKTGFYSKSRGGIPFGITNMNTYEANYASWYQSFADDNQSVIINYGETGLIPLWDLLPDNYIDMRVNMISAFMSYANNYNFDMTTFDYIGGHNCKVHGHENSISSKDDLYHTFSCLFCNNTYDEYHQYGSYIKSSQYHSRQCNICNHLKNEPHDIVLDIVKREFRCKICGYTQPASK